MRKRCFKCGGVFDIDEFYKHKGMLDGHLNKCKACTRKDTKGSYRARSYEDRIEYERKRNKTEARRKWRTEYQRKYRAANRKKILARQRLQRAVKSGRVEIGACEMKGSDCKGRIEAHHDDYDRPLEVRWFCHYHHRAHEGRTI